MPEGFNNTWGFVKKSNESSAFVPLIVLALCLTVVVSCFLASVLPDIIDEQENFHRRVWAIPFEERKWKDLVTLNTLHTFCGGPEPTLVTQRLHVSSHRCKFPDLSLYYIFLYILPIYF